MLKKKLKMENEDSGWVKTMTITANTQVPNSLFFSLVLCYNDVQIIHQSPFQLKYVCHYYRFQYL